MPVSYTIDQAHSLVRCVANGAVTQAELKAHYEKLDHDPAGAGQHHVLWDFSGVTKFDHSVSKFAETAEVAFAGKTRRRALVAPEKNNVRKLLQVWIIHREARGDRRVKLFSTATEALAWLAKA